MEARRRVEFAGGAELAAPMEKVMAGLVEKAAAGGRRGVEGGRPTATLRRGGDAGRQSGGTVERGTVESAAEHGRRALLQRYGEVSSF
jgi:hypothetical protein